MGKNPDRQEVASKEGNILNSSPEEDLQWSKRVVFFNDLGSVPLRAKWSFSLVSQKQAGLISSSIILLSHTILHFTKVLIIALVFDLWSWWLRASANIILQICYLQETNHCWASASSIRYLKATRFHPLKLCLCCFLFQSAHLAMIDTLMMAYTVETVSIEKVMACIRQYSSRDPEVETPYDTEDAVTTWINKVGNGVYIFNKDRL